MIACVNRCFRVVKNGKSRKIKFFMAILLHYKEKSGKMNKRYFFIEK